MSHVWLSVGAAGAIVNWLAVWWAPHNKHTLAVFVAKPVALLGLIFAVYDLAESNPSADPVRTRWFVYGLWWSLAGDVALMLPSSKLFLVGVGTFLAGHVCYIAGLHTALPPTVTLAHALSTTLPYALLVAVVGVVFTRHLARALRNGSEATGGKAYPHLVLPIAVYSAVLALMWWSSVAVAVNAGPAHVGNTTYAVVGATLFFASDAQLAWNKFVRPLWYGQLRVMSTYHVAQLLLALSLFKF